MSVVLDRWLEEHALTLEWLSEWGVTYDESGDRLVVPCNGPGGDWCLDVIRNFSAEPHYDLRPSHCRPGHILYGWDKTLTAIQVSRWAVVVEGWSDVVSLSYGGVSNVCGAFTAGLSGIQAALLNGVTDEVIIWGDDDEAGRIFAGFLDPEKQDRNPPRLGNVTGVVVQGHDPASFIASGGDPVKLVNWAYAMSDTYSLIEFTEEGRCAESSERPDQTEEWLA